MSAPNFKHVNTSKYYVFGTAKYYTEDELKENGGDLSLVGQYDEDGTQIDFEDALYNCKGELCGKGWSKEDESDGDFSYPATFFASKVKHVFCAGVEIDVTLSAKAVSGYYEAATFDYEADFEVRNKSGYYVGQYDEKYMTEESVISDDFCANKGLSKIQAKNIIRKVYEALQAMKDEAEEVFSMFSECECVVAYSCSNGETGYKKIA